MSAKKHIHQLKLLAKNKKKSLLLRNCSNSFIKAICECVLNVLKGNVKLTKRQKFKLTPYKVVVRKLGSKSLPIYKKRKILVQKGEGFLSFLIPAAISTLTSLFNGAH